MVTRGNTVRLAPHTWDQLREEADRRDVSMNALVQEAVVTYLAHTRALEQTDPTYEKIRVLVREALEGD